VSGIPFFWMFFGPLPGIKNRLFLAVLPPFSWRYENGAFAYSVQFLGCF
jgi:hypothetical protein